MERLRPKIVVIAGPNGAGKSTFASSYLAPGMVYINADEVAKRLPGYPSPSTDIRAGKVVLKMMDEFEARGESFAVETTLATRIRRLRNSGFEFHLVFVWSPSPDFSIGRVAARVRAGGHHIPEETIRRRYFAGLKSFFDLCQPLADAWYIFDNTGPEGPRRIAWGRSGGPTEVHEVESWISMREGGNDERR